MKSSPLHVILTYDLPIYQHFDKIKCAYYDSIGHDYIRVFNGDTVETDMENRVYNYHSSTQHISGTPDMWLKFKEILSMELTYDYDVIIRENSSTFLNMDNIPPNIISDSEIPLYAGFFEPSWDFVSGMAIWLNKLSIQLLRNATDVDINTLDDVLIGKYLTSMGVEKTHIDRYNISDRNDIITQEELLAALQHPIIRIKNDHNRLKIDCDLWNRIGQIVINKTK